MTTASPSTETQPRSLGRNFLLVAAILGAVLCLLCARSFQHGQALFSNDGPLAVQVSEPNKMPGSFFGVWNNLSWLGSYAGNFSPNITGLMRVCLGPYGYTNFHIFISTLVLGLAACFYFYILGLRRSACVWGGVAAALNSNFFSNAAWGLSSRSLSLAMTFLALAAVHSSFRRHTMLKLMLAGAAIGMSISEGGDNGAIFSLFVAAYAFCLTLFRRPQVKWPARAAGGVWRVAVMAVCAALLSIQTINVFMNVAYKGVVGTQPDTQSKEERWDWATQWSLPKLETLRVVVPGLFGYRVDSAEGGNYWGRVGQSPGWEPGSNKLARHSGAGEYAGVLVVLVALWTLIQAGRKQHSVYSLFEKQLIWFWFGAAMVACVLGWGRFAPFYQLVYALPYFSSIRNPMKFMHPFHMAVMVLFAMGLQGLGRCYWDKAVQSTASLTDRIKGVWRGAPSFEKRWMTFSLIGLAACVLFFIIYGSSRSDLVAYLSRIGFGETDAQRMARFSTGEVGLFVVFLALSVLWLWAVQSGWFGGARAKWAVLAMGTLLVVDMARANSPWIQYYNYLDRYESNPVIDVLKSKPYEHRVAVAPFDRIPALNQLQLFYHTEWVQHHFLYYNIEAMDVAQEPRMPVDKESYMSVFAGHLLEYWRLTNTRYLLGLGATFTDQLNQLFGKGESPFQPKLRFTIEASAPGSYQTSINDSGPFALIEITNALPRAALYAHWQVLTNDEATLNRLVAPEFDPALSVLLDRDVGQPSADAPTVTAGTAQITSYASRKIAIKTQAESPTVLLLNDRYHSDWVASVDGQPTDIIRANFIMRGVPLPAGQHEVVFRFNPPITTFYITLTAVLLGLALCVVLWLLERRPAPTATGP